MQELTKCWLNELAAPEILRFESELVADAVAKLEQQKEDCVTGAATSESATERARSNIYQMELDRIKFALASYLRCRLKKAERHARFIVDTPELHTRLSPQELLYLQQFVQLTDKALHAVLLSRLPEHLRGLSEPDMRDEPDLDQYVFALLQDTAVVQDNQERLELTMGDLVVIKYRTVQELVLQRRAILM